MNSFKRNIEKYFLFVIFLFPTVIFADAESGSAISALNFWIETHLRQNDFGIFSFLLLFLGGFIASLLPCTYPLYPITAEILRSRGNSNRVIHPIVYYSGLSFIYMIFGLIAGFSGGAFNTALRLPEINLAIAILLFLLGLSSIEWIHIPIFKPKQMGQNSESLSGTFLFGMGAGLLSSPCVGPIVVTVLLHLTTTQSGNSTVSVFFTSIKMLFFGLGVGLPFFAIGIFGMKLPKSGAWMRWVQYALGAFIFYFAYTYFEKSMDSFGFSKTESTRILLAIVVFIISVYLFQSEDELRHSRMRKALTLTGILIAVFVLYRSSISNNSKNSLNFLDKSELKIEESGNLKWYRNKNSALDFAKRENKKIFIDFYADWCSNCKKFQSLTLDDKDLNFALSKAALLKVTDTDSEFEEFANHPDFSELKIGLPFFAILDKEGKLIFKTTDYLNTKDMIRFLKE